MAKPKAVIFDVDGTLASTKWREHYVAGANKDWSAFHGGMVLDSPIAETVEAARRYHDEGYTVIALTLRPERFRPHMWRWFDENDVPVDELYLRPTNDYRDGAVVKRDIYEKQIKPRYDVVKAYDDYTKIVDMWTEAGVPAVNVHDPGVRPKGGVPAEDPKNVPPVAKKLLDAAEAGSHGVTSAVAGATPKVTSIRITPQGRMEVGKGEHMRTWIPPHPSVSAKGRPYKVKGHWRKIPAVSLAMERLIQKMGRAG